MRRLVNTMRKAIRVLEERTITDANRKHVLIAELESFEREATQLAQCIQNDIDYRIDRLIQQV